MVARWGFFGSRKFTTNSTRRGRPLLGMVSLRWKLYWFWLDPDTVEGAEVSTVLSELPEVSSSDVSGEPSCPVRSWCCICALMCD